MRNIKRYTNPTFTGIKDSNIVYADGGAIKKIVPYLSNIANQFRKLPNPIASQSESPVTPNLIRLDSSRNNIDVNQKILDKETDYKVSNPAIAQSLKAVTFSKALQAKNDVNQSEAVQNAQIKNQNSQFNQALIGRNIARQDAFNDKLVSRSIAQQNLLSDNLANVGDKFQQQQADESAIELENKRLSLLPEFYEKNSSGTSVYDRLGKRIKFGTGGEIDPTKPKVSRITNQPYKDEIEYTRQQYEKGEIPQNEEYAISYFKRNPKVNRVISGTSINNGAEFPNQVVDAFDDINQKSIQVNPRGQLALNDSLGQIPATDTPIYKRGIKRFGGKLKRF